MRRSCHRTGHHRTAPRRTRGRIGQAQRRKKHRSGPRAGLPPRMRCSARRIPPMFLPASVPDVVRGPRCRTAGPAFEYLLTRPEGVVSLTLVPNSLASEPLWCEEARRLRADLPAGIQTAMRRFEDNPAAAALRHPGSPAATTMTTDALRRVSSPPSRASIDSATCRCRRGGGRGRSDPGRPATRRPTATRS